MDLNRVGSILRQEQLDRRWVVGVRQERAVGFPGISKEGVRLGLGSDVGRGLSGAEDRQSRIERVGKRAAIELHGKQVTGLAFEGVVFSLIACKK